MNKKILLIIGLLIVLMGAFWAKGYYTDRYVVSNVYYTQVPLDEKNEESWIVDKQGVKQEKGKEYKLIGYDKDGNSKEVYFMVLGTPENYYAPGSYIKVNYSKTIPLGYNGIDEQEVPSKALKNIKEKGTRK